MFKDGTADFIETGTTTKDEVATAINELTYGGDTADGAPIEPIKFDGGDWWLYAQVRDETKWFFALVTPHGSGVDSSGDVDFRFLKVGFDENGVVEEYGISKSEGGGCNRDGVCVLEYRYMLLAPDEDDRAAKSFSPPGDRCGVYAYGDEYRAVSIWLDGQHSGWQVDEDQYFYWQLAPGNHSLAAWRKEHVVEFACAGGELIFFELDLKKGVWSGKYSMDIERQSDRKGRRTIQKARRTLMPGGT